MQIPTWPPLSSSDLSSPFLPRINNSSSPNRALAPFALPRPKNLSTRASHHHTTSDFSTLLHNICATFLFHRRTHITIFTMSSSHADASSAPQDDGIAKPGASALNGGFRPSHTPGSANNPMVNVQPPRREDLQPSYAQTLAGESDQGNHGWYGSMSK